MGAIRAYGVQQVYIYAAAVKWTSRRTSGPKPYMEMDIGRCLQHDADWARQTWAKEAERTQTIFTSPRFVTD